MLVFNGLDQHLGCGVQARMREPRRLQFVERVRPHVHTALAQGDVRITQQRDRCPTQAHTDDTTEVHRAITHEATDPRQDKPDSNYWEQDSGDAGDPADDVRVQLPLPRIHTPKLPRRPLDELVPAFDELAGVQSVVVGPTREEIAGVNHEAFGVVMRPVPIDGLERPE